MEFNPRHTDLLANYGENKKKILSPVFYPVENELSLCAHWLKSLV